MMQWFLAVLLVSTAAIGVAVAMSELDKAEQRDRRNMARQGGLSEQARWSLLLFVIALVVGLVVAFVGTPNPGG